MYSKGSKNAWVLVICLLAGITAGGALGEYLGGMQGIQWLKIGQSFGITEPMKLDLGILMLQLGFVFKINVASILGMIIGIFVYKKL